MPDTLPDLSREDFLAMLRSPDSPATLEWKISPTGIVDDDDDGLITAIVAVTGIVDEVNDVIIPGAFGTTLQRRTPKGVWSHDVHTWVSRTEAIGELLPGDSRLPDEWKGKPWPKAAGALVVRTRFNLGTRDGRDAYSNVKFFDSGPLGPQVEWSIGYNSLPGFTRRNKAGERELSAIDLYEYGPVLFGAMPLAGTVGTKARIDALEHKGAFMGGSTIIGDLELKVAGKEASPKDVKNTEKLKEYWEHGEGAAKIQWGKPGDFDRCVTELSKYLPPNQVKGYCANRHKGATGGWPGHAPGVEQAEADAKKAEHKAADLLAALEGKGDKPAGSMADGSFPITDGTSLKKAIKAHARAKDPDKAKAHIKRRAKAIGCEHMIPDQWGGTKDAALLDDTDVDDGGLADAVAALDAFEALGMTDEEIEAALADRGDEWTSLPEGAAPIEVGDEGFEPEGGGDEPAGGDVEPPAAGVEHKATRAAFTLEVGDDVLELKSAGGVLAGRVKATSERGALMGIALDTKAGIKTVWVPRGDECEVRTDPYREVKAGMQLVLERKDYPYLPGSVEERQNEIREAVNDLLLPEPDAEGRVRAYVSLDATFADYIVATLNDYSMPGPDDDQAFAIPYTVGDDGAIELGQPIPVEKQVILVPADADDTAGAAGAPTPTTPPPTMGGMDPALTLARKIATQAKALLDELEAKSAAGVDLSGTHVRRIRASAEALDGALAGLGRAKAPADSSNALVGEAAQLIARSALL